MCIRDRYAPATLNFTAGTFSPLAYFGIQVKDAIHPNINAVADYLTKYWIVTTSGTFTSPTYSFSANYSLGTADVTGTENNSVAGRWDGSNWANGMPISGGILNVNTLTSFPAINHFSAGNREKEINLKGYTGGTITIVSGSLIANSLNNTLFAATTIGSSAVKDYEIQNLGITDLSLTGVPLVSIVGANPGDFTVTTPPNNLSLIHI